MNLHPQIFEALNALKSGSDLRGVALSKPDTPNSTLLTLSTPAVYAIACALPKHLSAKCQKPIDELSIAIGHDSRLSAQRIEAALIEGLIASGVKQVRRLGLAATPALFRVCQDAASTPSRSNTTAEQPNTSATSASPAVSSYPTYEAADAGIMLTASHLPMERNGLKFFTQSGGFDHADLEAVLSYVETDLELSLNRLESLLPGASYVGTSLQAFQAETPELDRRLLASLDCSIAERKVVSDPFMHFYAQSLRQTIAQAFDDKDQEQPLKGYKILVDAGNGAGGFFVKDVLEVLGANCEGSLYLEPDGHFPNHIPNPELPAAILPLAKAVPQAQADLGIIFDTDVDRVALIAPDGREINRNRLIGLICAILVDEEPDLLCVTDSVTSSELSDFLKSIGVTHYRWRRGYRNVISQAQLLWAQGQNAQIAIETSGHAALRENDYLDDGAYLACRILAALAKGKREGQDLLRRLDTLQEPEYQNERRFEFAPKYVGGPEVAAIIEDLTSALEQGLYPGWSIDPENREGIRIQVSGEKACWMLLRASLHDPQLVLNTEGPEALAPLNEETLTKLIEARLLPLKS